MIQLVEEELMEKYPVPPEYEEMIEDMGEFGDIEEEIDDYQELEVILI